MFLSGQFTFKGIQYSSPVVKALTTRCTVRDVTSGTTITSITVITSNSFLTQARSIILVALTGHRSMWRALTSIALNSWIAPVVILTIRACAATSRVQAVALTTVAIAHCRTIVGTDHITGTRFTAGAKM